MKALLHLSILLCVSFNQATAKAQVQAVGSPDTSASSVVAADSAMAPLSETLTGEAKAEYAAARILYEDADYAGALTKLTLAYRLSADPRLLWNMAAAEKSRRHYAKVIEYVHRYLAAGAPYVNADDKTQAEQLLAAVQGFVSEVTLEVKPNGVLVEVDGQSVGTTPLERPLSLDFGHRTVRLTKHGYRTETQTLDLEGGRAARLSADLIQDLHQGTLKIVTDPQTTIRVDGRVWGVGLWQSVVTAGAHTVQLESDNKVPQTTEIVVADGETRTISILLKDVDEKKTGGLPAWAWIAGGVAVAGIGTGAYFLLRSNSERPPIQQGTWSTLEF